MSQYFNFYLAKKNDDGLFEFVAPFVRENGEFVAKSLLERSRSFIDYRAFEDMAESRIPIEDMDEYLKRMCTSVNFQGDEYSCGYAIPYKVMRAHVMNAGIYRGYVTPSEFKYIASHDFRIEDKYEVDLVMPEIVAENGKGDLVNVAFTAYNDTSYYANILINSVEEFVWDKNSELDNYYFVFETEY